MVRKRHAARSRANAYSDGYGYSHAHTDTDTDTDTDTYGYPDAHANAYAYPNADGYGDSHADDYARADGETDRQRRIRDHGHPKPRQLHGQLALQVNHAPIRNLSHSLFDSADCDDCEPDRTGIGHFLHLGGVQRQRLLDRVGCG